MDESWWKERIEEIAKAAKLRTNPLVDLDLMDRLFGNIHISTSDGYYPESGVDNYTESNTFTESDSETVNLEGDGDVPAENLYETPSNKQNSKRVYGSSARSSSTKSK